jgi:signal peptidase
MMSVNEIKELLLKFWRSDDEKISFIRDIVVAIFVVLVILMLLWGYTGQWFSAPMVAIESGSMMHLEEPFGRVGTIDAGDMVLLVNVDSQDDILTRGSSLGGEMLKGKNGYQSYGDYGDVIIYRKYGRTDDDQIIHRAICWVEVNTVDNQTVYTVEEFGIFNEESITISSLGLTNYRPSHEGYITKGDNPITNDRSDQAGGICSEPIRLSWVTGKARGELPWVGTVNLLFNDIISGSFWNNQEQPTVYNVPEDCIICLVLLIIILISIPVSLDIYDYFQDKQKKKTLQ